MYTLNYAQTHALNLLAGAFSELSDAWDDDLGKILNDLGVLPGRDLTEAAHELFGCLAIGKVGTRAELLDQVNQIDPAAKIGLKLITVRTGDIIKHSVTFAEASKHIEGLAAQGYDHCRVSFQWNDLSTHELEYDLYKDPFQYDLSKRAKHYLNTVVTGDKNMVKAFQIDTEAVQKLLDGYQLEDGRTV